jgi:hypothetical protein
MTKDKRSRPRMKVEPPRSNANLSVSSPNPLIAVACRGNHDIQYINNPYGGAEYVSKYVSKNDTAENKVLLNAVSRKLASVTLRLGANEQLTMRQKLHAVGVALISCQQIGTVHACYVLALSNYLVQSSRSSFFINVHCRKDITALPVILDAEVLSEMNGSESAISNSPRSQLGKRDAYHAMVLASLDKFQSCSFDFYAFASSYRTTKESSVPRGANSKIKEGLDVELIIDSETGLIKNAYSFTIGLVSDIPN